MIIKESGYGSMKQLKDLCKVLGTTDITKQVEEFNYSHLKDFAKGECFVDVDALYTGAVYCVYIAEGDPKDFDQYGMDGPGSMTNFEVVARLNAYEEGPYFEMPLEYLRKNLEREIDILRDSACINAPSGYDIQNCKFQKKNCICQCKRDT